MNRMLLSLCLLSIIVFSTAFEDGYEIHESVNKLYKFHKAPKSWYEATRLCRSENARLAMPANSEEATVLASILRRFVSQDVATNNYQMRYIYLGFHDMFYEGEYITEEDSAIQNFYHTWMDNEPRAGNFTENCGSLNRLGFLNDLMCKGNGCLTGHVHNWKNSYIDALFSLGEIDEPTSSVTICENNVKLSLSFKKKSGISTNKLNRGYRYISGLNRMYKLNLNIKTWAAARTICESENAHLAVINSDAERDFLKELLNEPGNMPNHAVLRRITYIGFHNIFDRGDFVTIKGDLMKQTDIPESSDINDRCGGISIAGDLHAIPCQTKGTFICEKKPIENSDDFLYT